MNIICTSMEKTISGVGTGSVIPLGSVIENSGFLVKDNMIIPRRKGTYHYNACLSVRSENPVRVVAWCDGAVVADAVGKNTIPMGFDVPKGEVCFTLECALESALEITIVSFAVSAFGYRFGV